VGDPISQGGCQASRRLDIRSPERTSACFSRAKRYQRFRLLNCCANAIHDWNWNSISHFWVKPCQRRPRQKNGIRLIFFNGTTRQLNKEVRLLLLHLRNGAK
jgi:hypothetical protein